MLSVFLTLIMDITISELKFMTMIMALLITFNSFLLDIIIRSVQG